jgi:hypothetical protein
MWPFKRKKNNSESKPAGPPCSFCGSTDTRLVTHHGSDQANFVRTWRGQRSLTYRCNACGQDFYGPEPPEGIDQAALSDDALIDDEEALRAAEEELNRQIREDDDRMYR